MSASSLPSGSLIASPEPPPHLTLATQHGPHDLPRHLAHLQARRDPPRQEARREPLKHARLDVPRTHDRRPHARRAVDVAQLEPEPLVERERAGFAGRVCTVELSGR